MQAVRKQEYKAQQVRVVELSVGKVPPSASEVEEAVLGAMLINKPGLDDAMMVIKSPDVFYKDAHRSIFAAMQELYDASLPVDIITVSQKLKSQNLLNEVGGDYYLIQLMQSMSSGAHTEFHSYILLQYYIKRCIILESSRFLSLAYNDDQDSIDLIGQWSAAQDNISEIVFSGKRDKNFAQELKDLRARVRFLTDKKPEEITGVSTGFANVDRFTSGWQPGDLIIVAADTGMGKTAYVLECALVNIKQGVPVGIISAEMSSTQLTARLTAQDTSFHLTQLTKKGFEKEQYFDTLDFAIERMNKYPIHIDDTGHPDITHVKSKARMWVRKHGCKLIICDYLQIIGDSSKTGIREQEVSSVSRQLKALAKELGVPIILLSQISKDVATRTDKRPRKGDLRESVAPAHDADGLLFVYRPEYYYGDNWQNYIDDDVLRLGGDTELIFDKYRGGAPNTVLGLKWIGDKTKYIDPAEYFKYENAQPGVVEYVDWEHTAQQRSAPLPTPSANEAFGAQGYGIEDKSNNNDIAF